MLRTPSVGAAKLHQRCGIIRLRESTDHLCLLFPPFPATQPRQDSQVHDIFDLDHAAGGDDEQQAVQNPPEESQNNPPLTSREQLAIDNFAKAKGLQAEQVTLGQLENTSEGVAGWAAHGLDLSARSAVQTAPTYKFCFILIPQDI